MTTENFLLAGHPEIINRQDSIKLKSQASRHFFLLRAEQELEECDATDA